MPTVFVLAPSLSIHCTSFNVNVPKNALKCERVRTKEMCLFYTEETQDCRVSLVNYWAWRWTRHFMCSVEIGKLKNSLKDKLVTSIIFPGLLISRVLMQVKYAAADAIVALHIIQSLVELKLSRQDKRELLAGLSGTDLSRLSLRPSLGSRQPLEQWLLKEENLCCLMSMCQGLVEVPYKQRRRSNQV